MTEEDAEPRVETSPAGPFGISMPRIQSRQTYEDCLAEAMAVAARYGVNREPDEITSYDGQPRAFGGPMSGPQGYDFKWNLKEGEYRDPDKAD